MQQLDNVAVGDQYSDAATLGPVPTTQAISVLVANNSVVMQVAKLAPSGTEQPWAEAFIIAPSTFQVQKASGVRFKNAVAGQQARVIAQLSEPADVQLLGTTPVTALLSASGGVSNQVSIQVVPLASWPPASPAADQLAILELPATYDPIGGKLIRWLFQWNATDAAWDCLSGPALFNEVDLGESRTSAVYGDLATPGPDLTIPVKGDYYVTAGMTVTNNAGLPSNMSYQIGATAALDADAVHGKDFSSGVSGVRKKMKTGLASLALVRAKYRSDGVNPSTFDHRWLTIEPVRLT